MSDKTKVRFEKVLAVLFALLLWQIAAMTVKSKILLCSPIDVAKRLCTIWQVNDFSASVWWSFYHIVGGFLLALMIGILLAAVASRVRPVEVILRPFLTTIKTVPVASFVVICLIWLSTEMLSVFIAFLIVLPVVYSNILEGLKSEDVRMLQLGKVFSMPPLRRLKFIHLPQLKPFILSACRTALGMAWKAGIAAEIIGTPDGSIGKQLYYSKICLDTDDLLAWTVIIVLLSVLFEKLFMHLVGMMYRRLERG